LELEHRGLIGDTDQIGAMCKSPYHNFLKALPKTELHLHIEGTLSPNLLFFLSQSNNIPLPTSPEYATIEALEERYNNFVSLQDFLDYYYRGMALLITEQDFEDLAWDYFVQANKDGVRHAEIFFDPQAHTARGIALVTVVQGITRARARALEQFGITSKLICCFLRHLPPQEAMETLVNVQSHFFDDSIHGIGLDSAEVPYPPELFKEVYRLTKELGDGALLLTAHAGEEASHTYITSALDNLKVGRIDHGIAAAQSEEVMARLKEKGTLLTVCPLSNVKLRCVEKISDLPLNLFLEKGVNFNINSDDPAYFGGYILENYCQVQKAFNWGKTQWYKVAEAGILGSHIDDDHKKALLQNLSQVQEQWQYDLE